MEPIIRESKTTSHFSLSFVLAGNRLPTRPGRLIFKSALLENDWSFLSLLHIKTAFSSDASCLLAFSGGPEGPAPQIRNLKILALNPNCDLDYFCCEARRRPRRISRPGRSNNTRS